ncbi:MAG TPA: hypothetical protein VHM19_13915 [Polyangiales bacterium]|jgi:hypothetical protein|nr:hypothetical protein [Polyangiales bacterium]
MGSVTALLLATPIFGFSLHAPAIDPAFEVAVHISAQAAAEASEADNAPANDSDASADSDSDAKKQSAGDDQAEYMHDLKRRNDIAGVHRIFGIATWASMTLTVALGVMSYYNLYGFGAGQGDNPCVKGTAIGGDSGCDAMRSLHAASAGLTTALYATTFTLSLMMPDPDNLSEGKGEFASTLRLHKTLRWVHFGGMIAQALIGIVIANNLLGLDRANNYGALQALATVHLGTGLITYGALTWAGALMTF